VCALASQSKVRKKTPYIYKYNKGNPTTGNVRWVLLRPLKVEIGRVVKSAKIAINVFYRFIPETTNVAILTNDCLLNFQVSALISTRKHKVTFLDNFEKMQFSNYFSFSFVSNQNAMNLLSLCVTFILEYE